MKKRTLLSALAMLLVSVATMAQVESGKVYRIVNKMYGSYAYESAVDNTIRCSASGTSTDYNQFWIVTETSVESNYTLQNVYTGRYAAFNNSSAFTTITLPTYMYINDNSSVFSGCYTFTSTKGGGWGMHCNSSATCVPWNTTAEATNWTFQEVTISDAEIEEARTIYHNFISTINNEATIAKSFETLFEDKACTIMKPEYAAMSDEELMATMSEVPADLQAVALKIKNDSWDTVKREKEFRIYDYKPYSDVNKWVNILYTRLYSPIENPTGICTVNDKSYIYVFVDEVPTGTHIELREMTGTAYFGTNTTLHEGLNIVPAATTDGFLYVSYICNTDLEGKKLEDYPAVKIHIENGYVNGFWSKERGHTNADWKYMQDNMFQNTSAIQVKGTYSLLDFRRKEFLENCPEKIEEIINLWDFFNETQQRYMNLDKYWPWFNNLQLAMSDDSGFMDAGNHRTHYNNNTLSTIVNWDVMSTDAGSGWGPLHEIGHNNQYAIEIVGTSEVSNNALANIVNFERGTHVSRGQNMTNQIKSFENKIPYVVRGESEWGSQLFSMTRMYYQLFLYAHAVGNNPEFYPQLYERLRFDRLVGWSTGARDELDENGYYIGSMDAKNDQLKFAEVCCELLNMDLSEFFEAWGFFIPMKNAFVGDYGHHYVYLHQEDIDASRARMQKYEKKGGHLMFLEDRVKPSLRKDGNGYRLNYADWEGERIGEVGDFGQWEDYRDTSVKAQGYYYTNTNGKIIIKEAEGASGALGFKLYNDETGELLTFTNKKSMNVPMSVATSRLRVVAAQADGTDYIVPSASEGPEDMQLEALYTSLSKVASLVANTSSKGNEVGKYHADAVTTLQEIYNNAKLAYDNKDTSEHSYADWSALLDEEYNNVANDERARLLMREGCKYYMYNAFKTARYLTYDAGRVIGQASNNTNGKYDSDADKQWTLVYAGEPETYFLKSESNYYISDITSGGDVYAHVSPAYAVKFKVNYTGNGRTYFTVKDNDALALGFTNANDPVGVGINPNETRGQWQVRLLEDNSANFESETLAELMSDAKRMLTEVTDTTIIESRDTVYINKNIKSNDILLQDYIKDLYTAYKNVDLSKTGEYIYYIRNLRSAFYNIEGKYSVIAPAASANGKIMWYAIISDVTDKAWSVGTQITLADQPKNDAYTDEMLWAIFPTAVEGEYKLINAAEEECLYRYIRNNRPQSSYCVASRTTEALPVSFVENNGTVAIMTGSNSFVKDTGNSTLLQYATTGTKTGWKFKLIAIEQNPELFEQLTDIEGVVVENETIEGNNETYDIFGRKVITPAKNTIYIKNGQKFINK